MHKAIEENIEWIKSGAIGCTFASLFARNPDLVGWKFILAEEIFSAPDDCFILSIVFPNCEKKYVKEWALSNGFYLEQIDYRLTGLRYKFSDGVSWVQYFGADASVKTRQCPNAMLTMCVKLPVKYYFKVGFKGLLHIAHASVKHLSDRVADVLWESSHRNTAKQLGHKPTIKEAAKTTFHE